jgi:hypothetical protein
MRDEDDMSPEKADLIIRFYLSLSQIERDYFVAIYTAKKGGEPLPTAASFWHRRRHKERAVFTD